MVIFHLVRYVNAKLFPGEFYTMGDNRADRPTSCRRYEPLEHTSCMFGSMLFRLKMIARPGTNHHNITDRRKILSK